ncbi:XRE family transcriptional regulator [Thermomonospora cellulosilytica]|uniref:Transcriptional regulator with XRE-family HTH domain n=1 Tax=Thermomonospora cellulosilytica TaxID=1411118 RepID=A0A7W3MY99_9ACTN|nr:XRE family transcriptional regulator [Thermomonospora cellulosilytica]MBA9004091.1 transcriptional regulator with XRE-family HTH domain [Thermomonospora cellulosilytica]
MPERRGDAPTETDIARRVRAHGLARGRTPAQIAADIHEQCGPLFGTTRIKARRLALGVALSDIVAQVRALYELEGKPPPKLGETLLSAYESGHKRPGPAYLHYLCAVYRAEPDELGCQGPCICGRTHAHRPADGPAPVPRPREEPEPLVGNVVVPMPDDRQWITVDRRGADGPLSADVGEEDAVLRRTLLQLLAGAGVALDGEFLGAVDHLRRRMDDTLVSATVSPTMLDQWEETTLGYGRLYQATPSLRMLCDVLLDFSEVRRMCAQRQPVELQERLCRIAAQLAGLSGLIMINLGDHRLARSFFRTASTAADETGDRALRAWVTVREALVPMYYGDPREALHLARKAQDLAGRAPSVAAAMAPAVEARALGLLAMRGRSDAAPGARRALVRGRSVFDQLSKAHTSDLAFGFTERQMAFYEGDTFTNLGDHRAGDEVLSRALTLYAPTDWVDLTLVRLDRAICRLHAGDADAALDVAQDAITELPAEHRSDILVHRARQVGAAVAARHGEIERLRGFREALSAPATSAPARRTDPAEQV